MTDPNKKDRPDEKTPYTEKKPKEAYQEHEQNGEDYKSPYVTEEPEPDKSEEEVLSPYTEPDVQKPDIEKEEELSPYTKDIDEEDVLDQD